MSGAPTLFDQNSTQKHNPVIVFNMKTNNTGVHKYESKYSPHQTFLRLRLHGRRPPSDPAHPLILQRLMETNLLHTAGYGTDEFSESARVKIRKACDAPDADIYFLVGGTQTNATVIGSILRPYQGVIAAETGRA